MSRLTAYADRLSARCGESLTFHVSAPSGSYSARVERLISVDEGPGGPGRLSEEIASNVDGNHAGVEQRISAGSYLTVPAPAALDSDAWAVGIAVLPSLAPAVGDRHAVFTRGAGAGHVGAYLTADGVEVTYRDGDARKTFGVEVTIEKDAWTHLVLARSGKGLTLDVRSAASPRLTAVNGRASIQADALDFGTGALTFAADLTETGGANILVGKLSSPLVLAGRLNDEGIGKLLRTRRPADHGHVAAAWDFASNVASDVVADTSGNGLDGRLVNMPVRAVTGPDWKGERLVFSDDPDAYDAIHFHAEDLEDARWEPSFTLTVGEDWKSGIYVLVLNDGNTTEQVPFYVRPIRTTAEVLFLAPTNTYLAYGNQKSENDNAEQSLSLMKDEPIVGNEYDEFLAAHPEYGLSLYDLHSDGIGVRLATRLRPVLTMRPDYRAWLTSAPRHFAADFYITGWLEHEGIAYDVATDEDLHNEGVDLLAQYKVVVTGSHPEYCSGEMLDAIEAYTSSGGRLMYLGGNGFYWVTTYALDRPHVIEVRRGYAGNADFRSPWGEGYHQTTGEVGGIWRLRGRTPNKLVGIGYGSNGWAKGAGYMRSDERRYSWIFDGIKDDEVIGDFGLVLGAAGGDELDRADTNLGTPPQTAVLASTRPFSDYYQPVSEDHPVFVPDKGGSRNPTVRADITLFETPSGGAVFATGSISWAGAIAVDKYDNNVALLTGNALRGLLGRTSLD